MSKCCSVISVYLCVPKNYASKVNVNVDHCVGIFQKRFPNEHKKFIYNGQYLMNEFTFGFYGIKNDDVIVAVSDDKNKIDFSNNNWMHASRDSEDIANRIAFSMNAKTRPEASRLRDLKFMSIERKAKVFRKMCNMVNKTMDDIGQRNEIISTIIDYDYSNEAPSVEALPVCWDEKEFSEKV